MKRLGGRSGTSFSKKTAPMLGGDGFGGERLHDP